VPSLLWKFAKQHPGPTIIYVALLALIPLQDIGLPHIYGSVINSIQNKRPLVIPFLIVLSIIVVIQIGIVISDWNETFHTYPKLIALIRKEILSHIFAVHETDYDEQNTAALISKMIKLPTVIYNLIDQYKIVLIPQIIVCVAMIFYFATHDIPLATGLFVAIVIIITVVNWSPELCSNHAVKREDIMIQFHEKVDDVLRNMMAVYNTDSKEIENELMDRTHEIYVAESRNALGCVLKTKVVLVPIIISMFGFFMWRCYTLLKRGKMNTGTFVSLFLIMMSLLGSMSRYVGQVKELVARRGLIEAVLSDFRTFRADEPNKQKEPRRPPPVNGEIVIHNLSYTYPGSNAPILRGVTITVPKGQRMLIVGRIGCGKTTLLRLLMKYKTIQYDDTFTNGEIWLQHRPYTHLGPQEIRATVGYVPQTPILFNRTIYENIVYPFSDATSAPTKTSIMELMSSLNLSHIFDTFSGGLDENVGKNGSRLSGGQRQIVWIMRVLLQNPAILLMDEPTASIDEKTKDIVRELLSRVMHERTVIMVTHDQFLERFADRVIELEGGRVVRDEVVGFKHHSFI